MTTRDDVVKQLEQILYDLSVTRTRVSEALRAVAALPSEPDVNLVCRDCGVSHRSTYRLAEHRYAQHGGPVPQHFLDIEARAEPVMEPPVAMEGAA